MREFAAPPVIIDCDPGHDDALALLLAAGDSRLRLLGVTTVAGNQTLEKTTGPTSTYRSPRSRTCTGSS